MSKNISEENMSLTFTPTFPANPLAYLKDTGRTEYHRRLIANILESYNSNYDVLAEAVQNAIDATEDAYLAGCPKPFIVEVTINLAENSIAVLDTGIGMTQEQLAGAFAPSISFKSDPTIQTKRGKKYAYANQ